MQLVKLSLTAVNLCREAVMGPAFFVVRRLQEGDANHYNSGLISADSLHSKKQNKTHNYPTPLRSLPLTFSIASLLADKCILSLPNSQLFRMHRAFENSTQRRRGGAQHKVVNTEL